MVPRKRSIHVATSGFCLVSMCTFVLALLAQEAEHPRSYQRCLPGQYVYFFTSKASKLRVPSFAIEHESKRLAEVLPRAFDWRIEMCWYYLRDVPLQRRLPPSQYVSFCTSKASNLT